MNAPIFVPFTRAELDALTQHLRESVVTGRHHWSGVTLGSLDLESATAKLEAATRARRTDA